MHLVKKLSTVAVAVVAMMAVASPAKAQFRLPAPHADQHNSLISHQSPVGVDLNKMKFEALNNFQKRNLVRKMKICSITIGHARPSLPLMPD